MSVAYRYFLNHGYSGTTMSGVAAALGGSKGTLWSYFPRKEQLFEAVLDHATTEFAQQISHVLQPGGGFAETLDVFCKRYLAKLTSPEALALHRMIVSEVGRFPELGRIFFERAPHKTHMILARFFEQAMDEGQMRGGDPLVAARTLTGLCLCGTYNALLFGLRERATQEMIEEDARHAVTVFLRAYAPPFQ